MKRFVTVISAALLWANIGFGQEDLTLDDGGDPTLSHEANLDDLQRKLEVASMRFLIASEIAKIAEEEAKTAISQAEGAEQKRLKTIAETTSRQSSPGRISLVTARLVAAGSGLECDAKWMMAYSCNGLPECAVELDPSVCGSSAASTTPMNMVVNYACGKPDNPEYENRRGEFSFQDLSNKSMAYLTCY